MSNVINMTGGAWYPDGDNILYGREKELGLNIQADNNIIANAYPSFNFLLTNSDNKKALIESYNFPGIGNLTNYPYIRIRDNGNGYEVYQAERFSLNADNGFKRLLNKIQIKTKKTDYKKSATIDLPISYKASLDLNWIKINPNNLQVKNYLAREKTAIIDNKGFIEAHIIQMGTMYSSKCIDDKINCFSLYGSSGENLIGGDKGLWHYDLNDDYTWFLIDKAEEKTQMADGTEKTTNVPIGRIEYISDHGIVAAGPNGFFRRGYYSHFWNKASFLDLPNYSEILYIADLEEERNCSIIFTHNKILLWNHRLNEIKIISQEMKDVICSSKYFICERGQGIQYFTYSDTSNAEDFGEIKGFKKSNLTSGSYKIIFSNMHDKTYLVKNEYTLEVYKTIDGGKNWTKIIKDITGISEENGQIININNLLGIQPGSISYFYNDKSVFSSIGYSEFFNYNNDSSKKFLKLYTSDNFIKEIYFSSEGSNSAGNNTIKTYCYILNSDGSFLYNIEY